MVQATDALPENYTAVQCPPGFLVNVVNNTCVLPINECAGGMIPAAPTGPHAGICLCPLPRVYRGGSCVLCPAGFTAVRVGGGRSRCQLSRPNQCLPGYKSTGTGACVQHCPLGFRTVNGKCVLPATTCNTNTSSSITSSMEVTGEGTCVVANCPAGFTASPSACSLPTTECLNASFTVFGDGTCNSTAQTACPQPRFTQLSTATTDGHHKCVCAEGYVPLPGSQPAECVRNCSQPNQVPTPDLEHCQCKAGYDTNNNGECVVDECPDDAAKTSPGACGCGTSDADEDGDGYLDHCAAGGKAQDGCPLDASKAQPGVCGCGVPDDDTDGDGACNECAYNGTDIDGCPNDAAKTAPGLCGCGLSDDDSDGDGYLDSCASGGKARDLCPTNPLRVTPPCECSGSGCTYAWRATSDWSPCSSPVCGLGVTNRTVLCTAVEAPQVIGNASQCTNSTPVLAETGCRLRQCKHSYVVDDWGTCVGHCGVGVQNRSLRCLDQDARQVALHNCGNQPSPATERSCWTGVTCAAKGAANTTAVPTTGWAVSDWSACSATCGGNGLQTRSATCVNTAGVAVPASRCSVSARPATSRSCATQPCQDFTWAWSPYGECSSGCGGGTQTRLPLCRGNLGMVDSPTHCDDTTKPAATAQVRQCNTALCPSTFRYTTSAWSTCSDTCAAVVNGTALAPTRSRQVRCVDTADAAQASVPLQLCSASGTPPPSAASTCIRTPCRGYAWAVTDWQQCSAACNGRQTRTVSCFDVAWPSYGGPVADALCDAATKPVTRQPCSPGHADGRVCTFCELHGNATCGGRGVCVQDKCECTSGYQGTHCQTRVGCSGVEDALGGCCGSGLLSVDGACCHGDSSSSTPILDRHGKCCASGFVDVCGTCDGNATVVDALGDCCSSGIVDSAGLCCSSGVVDACGVCDGRNECRAIVDIRFVWPDAAALADGGPTNPAAADVANDASDPRLYIEFMLRKQIAGRLGLPNARVSVTSVAAIASRRRRLTVLRRALAPGVTPTHVATMAIVPAHAAGAVSDLVDLNADVCVTDAGLARVEPVCGNGVCELGERCNAQSPTASCCRQDCPFLESACPVSSSSGQQCSGRGTCVAATTAGDTMRCACFVSFAGAACEECGHGFVRRDSGCAKLLLATCFDGIRNGNEAGVDCGGNCTVSCGSNIVGGDPFPIDTAAAASMCEGDRSWICILLLVVSPVLCCICFIVLCCCLGPCCKDRRDDKQEVIVTPANVYVLKQDVEVRADLEPDEYDDGSYVLEEQDVMVLWDGGDGEDEEEVYQVLDIDDDYVRARKAAPPVERSPPPAVVGERTPPQPTRAPPPTTDGSWLSAAANDWEELDTVGAVQVHHFEDTTSISRIESVGGGSTRWETNPLQNSGVSAGTAGTPAAAAAAAAMATPPGEGVQQTVVVRHTSVRSLDVQLAVTPEGDAGGESDDGDGNDDSKAAVAVGGSARQIRASPVHVEASDSDSSSEDSDLDAAEEEAGKFLYGEEEWQAMRRGRHSHSTK